MLSKQENFGDQTWTKIVWKPHIFPFWTSGLIVFDKVWTPTNIWWNIVKIVYVWKVIKHVWYRFTTPYKRCLILYGDLFKWFRVLEIYLAKSWFYFADFTLQLYWFCYNSKFIWRKTRFFLARFAGLYSCYDFVILVNISDEKLDFFFARFAGLYNCNDFVSLVNWPGEKFEFFWPDYHAFTVVLILLYHGE